MNKNIGPVVLRVALALVFFWFSYMQLSNPDQWSRLVPDFIIYGIFTANLIVVGNGFLEMILGSLLLVGLYTRIVSLILALHLAMIALSFGMTPVGVRDFGLTFATFSLFFTGAEYLSLDAYFKGKDEHTRHMAAHHLSH